MSLNRTSFRLAFAAMVLASGLSAFGQQNTIHDGQLFAPADIRPYGEGVRPHEGFFFSIEGFEWSISKPNVTTVGAPGLTRLVFLGPTDADAYVETNSVDTSLFRSKNVEGTRIEFGRVCDHSGWIFSSTRPSMQNQRFTTNEASVVFNDPEFGPLGLQLLEGIVGTVIDPITQQPVNVIRDLPVTFDELVVYNEVETWSLEVMGIHRTNAMHHGGVIEWFFGARYMQFDEQFNVSGNQLVPETFPNILANSEWETEAQNHIVGPQFGVHYFKLFGKFGLSAEGRFLSGANFQNFRQRGVLGTRLNPPGGQFRPRLMDTSSFTHVEHNVEFSPVGELRLNAKYQITRAVALKAGWTGTMVGRVTRASEIVNYTVPAMGILSDSGRDDVFVQGVTFGIDINR